MPTHEELSTSAWLVSRIEADAGLQAYLDLIPEDVNLPAVRMSVRERRDVRGIGDQRERIMTRLDWLVVAVHEGLLVAPLLPLAAGIDVALQNKNGSTAEIVVLSCVRLEPFTMVEADDTGVQYRHAGGIYRTMVQAP